MIRVILPGHLRHLAKISSDELLLELSGPVTVRAILDAIEARYPMLEGTIREHITKNRRAYLRFYACEEDISHDSPETVLPEAIATGQEPFWVVGAISGG